MLLLVFGDWFALLESVMLRTSHEHCWNLTWIMDDHGTNHWFQASLLCVRVSLVPRSVVGFWRCWILMVICVSVSWTYPGHFRAVEPSEFYSLETPNRFFSRGTHGFMATQRVGWWYFFINKWVDLLTSRVDLGPVVTCRTRLHADSAFLWGIPTFARRH